MFVPALHRRVKLPSSSSFLRGEWISERCEPIPQERFDRAENLFELFMTRNFRVDPESRRWELQTKYYSEASCARLLAEQQSYGLYDRDIDSKTIPGATDIDFKMEKSFFLVWDSSLLKRIQKDPSCGYFEYWEVRNNIFTRNNKCNTEISNIGGSTKRHYEISRTCTRSSIMLTFGFP